jgi:hypothetical protein
LSSFAEGGGSALPLPLLLSLSLSLSLPLSLPFAFCLLPFAFGTRVGLWQRLNPAAKRPLFCEGQVPHSNPVTVAVNFLLPFSAQESHVKPQNNLTRYQSTTSAWHFSSTQSSIIKLEIKKRPRPRLGLST